MYSENIKFIEHKESVFEKIFILKEKLFETLEKIYSENANAESVRLYLANGESICYTQGASGMLKTVPAEVTAVEIVMPAMDAQYAISEIVVMTSK